MRYWLTAIAAAGLTIAAGWLFLLNQTEVAVQVAPSRTLSAPLGAALLAAFGVGAAAVALLAGGGAIARGWRATGARRQARRERRGHDAIARVRRLVWTGETSTARAELLRAPEHGTSEGARLALLAETHLQEGDPSAAREVLEGAAPTVAGDPQLLDLLARAADELGDRRTAIDALERAYRAAPGSPRLATRLRDLYAAEGRWSEATARQAEVLLHLRTPARLAAERDTLLGLRYEASLAEEDHQRAARQLRGLAREAPDFLPAWVSAGDRYAQAGRAFVARRTWLRGLRRRPAAALVDRITAHDGAAGQPQRTTRLLRSLMRRHPDAPAVAAPPGAAPACPGRCRCRRRCPRRRGRPPDGRRRRAPRRARARPRRHRGSGRRLRARPGERPGVPRRDGGAPPVVHSLGSGLPAAGPADAGTRCVPAPRSPRAPEPGSHQAPLFVRQRDLSGGPVECRLSTATLWQPRMAQIFHRSTNTLSRVSIFGAAVLRRRAPLAACRPVNRSRLRHQPGRRARAAGAVQPQAPRRRAGHRLPLLPHLGREVSPCAGIPPTKTCMNCHSQIWTSSHDARAGARELAHRQVDRLDQGPRPARLRLLQPQHPRAQGRRLRRPATAASTR